MMRASPFTHIFDGRPDLVDDAAKALDRLAELERVNSLTKDEHANRIAEMVITHLGKKA